MGGATFACLPHCLPSLSPPNLLLIPASPSLPPSPSLPLPPSMLYACVSERDRCLGQEGRDKTRGGGGQRRPGYYGRMQYACSIKATPREGWLEQAAGRRQEASGKRIAR